MRRMLQTVVVCVVLAVVSPVLGAPGPSVTVGLDDALRNLDGAMSTLERSKPSRARDVALRQMAVTRLRLVEALTLLGGVPGTPSLADDRTPPPPPPMRPLPARPLPMEAGAFRDLVNDVKELPFSKDQLAFLRDASRHHYFLTDQVRQAVAVFSFGKDKVDAAATLYPRTLDHAEFYKVLKELEFESDRDALRRRLQEIDRSGLPAGT
jgi:hypothetical protein